jgi:allantoate deiminase
VLSLSPANEDGVLRRDTAIEAAAARIIARCEELRAVSAEPNAYTRLYLTPEHRAAADLIAGWMEEAGLAASMDAAGNLIGRLEGLDAAAPTLVLGSHFDTVRDAGTYDGQLGVAAAIEVAAALNESGAAPAVPLEVHAYADEEGVRFHTMLLGSGFVAGLEGPAVLARTDAAGVTMAEAMRGFGLDPGRIGEARRRPCEFRAYLELHIEQGPVLEAEGLPLGTVTGFAGQTRGTVTLRGEAGHAGTVPMRLRRDALAAAAEAVLAIESVARSTADVVATVGELSVLPGAGNVIPGEALLTLDLRSADDARRAEALAAIRAALDDIAQRRGVAIDLTVGSETSALACDPDLIAIVDRACEAVQGRALPLVSGAGHDAMAMARLCPVAMIFLRCEGGVGHNPAERVSGADAGAGFAALIHAVGQVMAKCQAQVTPSS